MGCSKYSTNRNSTCIMFGGQLVQAVLKLGWVAAGKSFKGPEKMGLIVIILVNIFFEALQLDTG